MLNRRHFIRAGAATAALLAFRPRLYAFGQSPILRKFVQPLPGLGATGIPVATPNTTLYPGADFYSMEAGEFTQSFHPDLTPSKLWGYADTTSGPANHRYLGGVIVAKKGRPVILKMKNQLPNTHPLPVDDTIMGANDMGLHNRISVHLHGGLVPWNSDGGPFAWFGPGAERGPSFANGTGQPGEAQYYYPNDQSSRLMWYHDHAMGITRLNAYAGLASAYVLRDDVEDSLVRGNLLPSSEVPLVIQDKTFFDGSDAHYPAGKKGDLWYPYQYENRWDYGPNVVPKASVAGPLPPISIVPEFFADTAIVNGAAYPKVSLEPRHYRFRILNGSQARFYNLQLYYADTKAMNAKLNKAGPPIIQIGTEAGFLPMPVKLNDPPQQIAFDQHPNSPTFGNATRYNLLLAPGERADVVINFSNVPAGSKLILYNDAPAPFPMGDPLNDYGASASASGPDTRNLMRIEIVQRVGAPDHPLLDVLENIALQGNNSSTPSHAGGHQVLPLIGKLNPASAVKVRELTLNEDFDELGRLIQKLGTNRVAGTNSQGNPTFARGYTDATTEEARAGDVEIWKICNLTGDTHPIHFHLANVQVLSRQPFDAENYTGRIVPTGPARSPDLNEMGWKETVRMNPCEVTTVIMKLDLPKVPFHIPLSPRTGGHEYVWHCHILEHEEHDMMRPLVVR